MDYNLLKEILSLLNQFECENNAPSKDTTAFINWLLKDYKQTPNDSESVTVPNDDLEVINTEIFVAMIFRLAKVSRNSDLSTALTQHEEKTLLKLLDHFNG